MRFIDTNVLLYCVSTHSDETRKAEIAASLLDGDDLCLSVQVLQEFYVQTTRSSRLGALSRDEAQAFIAKWLLFPVREMTVALMQQAFEAARLRGCREVLSEDLGAGLDYGGVLVANPFA